MALYKGAASEAGRALQLKKKREKALEELEHRKRKIEEELKLSDIENKFAAHYDAVEQQLKSSTIGLVTLDEMKAKQEDVVKERERQLAQKQHEKELQRQKEMREKQEAKERQKRQIASLSFRMDEDDEEEDEEDGEKDNTESYLSNTDESLPPQKKICKNPDVDTSFLPDREREEEERKLREELRQVWVQKQEKLKNEEIEITFSYWDGSGHRRSVKMKKGHSIYQFLLKCLEVLRKEFHELRAVTGDQLMYVKEDLIIPHHYTFYDFIVTKARGKSGPLFSFDVHDDVRLVNDASVEKDESHAGKVLLRSWYERNKHIFPASRWEPYDPTKNYEKYTISDRKK
ncbi:protein FAM50 homolog [Trichonephila clavipes]|nr:protein FAM50 homolog [Trichonephila clavipes]